MNSCSKDTVQNHKKRYWSKIILLDTLKTYWNFRLVLIILIFTTFSTFYIIDDYSYYISIKRLLLVIVLFLIYAIVLSICFFLEQWKRLYYLWLSHVSILSIILMIIYIAPDIIATFPNWFLLWIGYLKTTPSNAQYLLSTLIQSEAAILAIVITLSLVAIQHASSTYSPRLIEIFRKKPDLWILLLFYALLIIYGLFVLKKIDVSENLDYISLHIEEHIIRLLFGSICALIYLAIYLKNTLNLLDPISTIKWIIAEINPQTIECSINGDSFYGVDNSIQQCIDVMYTSIERHDTSTVMEGTRYLEKSFNNKIKHGYFEKEEINKIHGLMLFHLRKLGYACILNREYYSFSAILFQMEQSGIYAIEKKEKDLFSNILSNLSGFINDATSLKIPLFTEIILHFSLRLSDMTFKDKFEDIYPNMVYFFAATAEKVIKLGSPQH